MKRILFVSLAILLAIVVAFGVRYKLKNELKKRAREKREVAYKAALHLYSQALPPGTSRKEVEAYLKENKVVFRQTCCVDMKEYKKGSWDDFVQIGEEDAPWFCNSLIVDVGFQFAGSGNFDGTFRANDSDKLKAVTLYRHYDKCL